MLCPCGSKKNYADCCEVFHQSSEVAETAEQLMRSRYSAYALGLPEYIVSTTYPCIRSSNLLETVSLSMQEAEWQSLKIVKTFLGKAKDKTGKVEFIANYHVGDKTDQLHEYSRFKKYQGKWYYLDGVLYH